MIAAMGSVSRPDCPADLGAQGIVEPARQGSLRDAARRRHVRHSPRTSSGAMMIVWAGWSVDTGCPAILR